MPYNYKPRNSQPLIDAGMFTEDENGRLVGVENAPRYLKCKSCGQWNDVPNGDTSSVRCRACGVYEHTFPSAANILLLLKQRRITNSLEDVADEERIDL